MSSTSKGIRTHEPLDSLQPPIPMSYGSNHDGEGISTIYIPNSGLNRRLRSKIPTILGSWRSPDTFELKINFLGLIGKKQTDTLHQISS